MILYAVMKLSLWMCCIICVLFFMEKTAYKMRISDWSSDVCSSDLSLFDKVRRQIPSANTAHCRGTVNNDQGKANDCQVQVKSRIRSEERSEGEECVCTCRSRWSQNE